ncbi:helix-turn-helix domain-containing protein [Empedobacter falsenii]
MENVFLIQASELEKFADSAAKNAVERVLGIVNNDFDIVVNDIGRKHKSISDSHFTVKEAADFFKCTTRTMYNWKNVGKLEFILVGGEYFCSKEEAYKLLDKK